MGKLRFRFIGGVLFNTLVAVIGTAVLETAVYHVVPAKNFDQLLLKEYILSSVFAAVLGFLAWRIWRSNAAFWAWVVPGLWFGLRFVVALGRPNVWQLFSGVGCAEGFKTLGCRHFFLFTIPFVRSIAYVIGGAVSRAVEAKEGTRAANA